MIREEWFPEKAEPGDPRMRGDDPGKRTIYVDEYW